MNSIFLGNPWNVLAVVQTFQYEPEMQQGLDGFKAEQLLLSKVNVISFKLKLISHLTSLTVPFTASKLGTKNHSVHASMKKEAFTLM